MMCFFFSFFPSGTSNCLSSAMKHCLLGKSPVRQVLLCARVSLFHRGKCEFLAGDRLYWFYCIHNKLNWKDSIHNKLNWKDVIGRLFYFVPDLKIPYPIVPVIIFHQ